MGGGTQCMCRYHEEGLSQYVHIGYSTQALYCRIIRRAFVFTCSMNHHTTGPEHLMSTVEKKTVHYILHHNVKSADAKCMRQYRACVL